MNRRLEALADYPFSRLARLLDGVAPGAAAIDMAIGEPRHPPPAFLADVLAANAEGWRRYPPVAGTPEFRAAAVAWLERRFGLAEGVLDPARHVLPVAGTREALFDVALALVESKETAPARPDPPAVLMPNPFYQVYLGAAVMAGAEPVCVEAGPETGFLPDYEGLPEALLRRTCLAYLCTPANPQGSVAGRERLSRLLALARAHGFVLVVDECYSEIYTRTPPPGALEAAAASGDLANLLVFHSLSKRSNVPGLRVGFVAGDPALIAAFAHLRRYSGGAVPLPVQAAAAALLADERHVEESRALYRAKFALAERVLGGRFPFTPPAGAFYLWLEVGDGERAARRLWAEAGVKVLPGGYLGHPGPAGFNPGAPYVRLALVHDAATTERALERFVSVLGRAAA